MRCLLILTCTFFSGISIFFTVVVMTGGDSALDADCTPAGTHLSDTFSGACPDLESHDITSIGKASHFNVNECC